jgi:hypothetical protein
MGLQQAGLAAADQKRLEYAVATDGREVIGMQQRGLRVVKFVVERDQDRRLARHGQEA